MTSSSFDVIDHLVGIAPGAALDIIRTERPDARTYAQASYQALLEPEQPGSVSLAERKAVAAFVVGLHGDAPIAAFYAQALARVAPTWVEPVLSEVRLGLTEGPYGAYPAGPLSREDRAGPEFRASDTLRTVVGPRLAAAFEHAHFLVFHPRDASPERLKTLAAAGWGATDIVILSQLVAFLAFQIRVIAGLRVLKAAA